jgi:type I restriction enzyme S subunit
MEQVKKGYKKTEVGVIPEDWDVVRIGSFTDCTAGGTPSTNIKSFWGGNNPWMNSGELNLKHIYDVGNRITEEGLKNSSTKYIPKYSVLIGLAGQGKTRGTAAINYLELCTNQSIASIFPSSTHNSFFLYYFLDSQYYELRKLSTGDGGRGGLNLGIIKNIFVPLPPLPEQTAIANALSDMDELITQTEKLIEKKKAIKQGVMQELLRPKEGWVKFTIDQCCEILNNLRKPLNDSERQKMKGDIPYCGANGIVDFISNYLTDIEIILMAEDGGYFDEYKTRPIAYRMSGKCWVNNHAHILKAKINFNQDFIYYSVVHKNILDYINGGTRAKLNKSELKNIEIYFPEKKEQDKVSKILNDLDTEIDSFEKRHKKLKLQKQGMMQVLLTGKIRLV